MYADPCRALLGAPEPEPLRDDRCTWLLGETRPVWKIPMGLDPVSQDELASVTPDDHQSLESLDVEASVVDGIHQWTVRYPEGGASHGVVVSCPNEYAVRNHLASTSVWFKTVEPAFLPVSVADELTQAIAAATGTDIAGLLTRSGADPKIPLAELVGIYDVRARALVSVENKLGTLRSSGAIEDELFGALDTDLVVDDLLARPAEDFVEGDDAPDHSLRTRLEPGAVVCGIAPDTTNGAVLFRLQDIGTISQRRSKTYWAGGGSKQSIAGTVQVRSGRVRVSGAASATLRSGSSRSLAVKPSSQAYVRAYAYQRSSVVVSGLCYKTT